MARSHARIFTSIWDDPAFLARSGQAQRLYFVLLSQPNLGHAGILPTTVRRWTLLSADEDEGVLRSAMAELAAHRFVIVDERTEELLVRTLIRNDGVYKQPKVLAVAITEAASIRSPLLRACVAEELARLDDLICELPETTRPAVEALLKDLPYRLANAHLELGDQGGQHAPSDPPANLPPHPLAERGREGGSEVLRARTQAAPTPATDPIPLPVPLPAGAENPRAAEAKTTVSKRGKPRPPSGNVGDVVAAYVEGAVAAGLPRPDESLRRRVGKQAGEILARGEIELEALTEVGRHAGAGGWSDLAVQIQRDAVATTASGPPKQTNYTDEEYKRGWS